MVASIPESPFHRGEQRIQTRLGVRERVEKVGRRAIRRELTCRDRDLFARLPIVFIGSVDGSDRPWASVLGGRPGFARSNHARSLTLDTTPIYGDPLHDCLQPGRQIGVLGIEYATRRRVRVNGTVASESGAAIDVAIEQAFGNCRKYIQVREYLLLPSIDAIGVPNVVQSLNRFDDRARAIVADADNFYIATCSSLERNEPPDGADVSHRGGKPGFVKIVDERTLLFPDFSGNSYFNTLGNLLSNPRAGLAFIDFHSGDIASFTGYAQIIWDMNADYEFAGAERFVRFELEKGVLIRNGLPIRWRFSEWSPALAHTGEWA